MTTEQKGVAAVVPATEVYSSSADKRTEATAANIDADVASGSSATTSRRKIEGENKDINTWLRDDCQQLYQEEIIRASHAQRIGKRARMIRYSVNHSWTLKNRFPMAQFLEFGVYEGKDICRIAAFLASKMKATTKSSFADNPVVVHGFDSFQGLPEDWHNGQNNPEGQTLFGVGAFNTNGKAPEVEELAKQYASSHSKKFAATAATTPTTTNCSNVEFHVGWFEDTVAKFLDDNPFPIAFVHADADLYGSTLTFLDAICQRKLLKKGSVICFDEYWNYENWQQGEYKAWREIVDTYNLQFQYLCYHAPGEGESNYYGYQSVSVVISWDMK